MIVTVPSRTRGYECDHHRVVTLPVYLSFLEQMRWEWIQNPELGLIEHIHTGHFFVVRRQTLALARHTGMCVDFAIRGVLRKTGRSLVSVEHDLVRADGVLMARAKVQGVWIGPNRRMARLPRVLREHVFEGVLESEEGPAHEGSPSSFMDPPQPTFPVDLSLEVPPPDLEGAESELVVRPTDCDIFGHVNASSWLRYFEDVRRRRDDRQGRIVAIDYSGEALAGEPLTIVHDWTGDVHSFVLKRHSVVLCRAAVQVHDPR